eukprot:4508740-Pyramimonas_sp.AAC.1
MDPGISSTGYVQEVTRDVRVASRALYQAFVDELEGDAAAEKTNFASSDKTAAAATREFECEWLHM